MVKPPILDDLELTTLANEGGYSNVVSLNEYSSVFLLSLCAVASQRWMWENKYQRLTDSDWENILSKIAITEDELITNLNIGSFFWSIQLFTDPSLLICLGQTVPVADYPELSVVVPSNWIVGSDIQLPSLISTGFIGGMDIPSLGQITGSNEHTLTESEMPSHTHTQQPHSHGYQSAVINPTLSGLEPIPSIDATPVPAVTNPSTAINDFTGGGQPHNNVQRSLQLVPYLVAR